ncbi:MAG: sulfatase [Polyangiales bacterium]
MSEGASSSVEPRGGARAGAIAALALGLLDGANALRRSPAPAGESALFVAGVVATIALVLTPAGALGVTAARSLSRATRRSRSIVGAVVGAGFGLALGFALFSGSAMQRSAARPWLIATAVALSAAVTAIALRGSNAISSLILQHKRLVSALLAAVSLAVGYAHATMFVRLYPALHAIAALLCTALAVTSAALGLPTVRQRWSRPSIALAAAALALCVIAGADLLRSQRARARARQHTAIATYAVRAAGRLIPQRAVRAVVDDDRVVEGPSLDLEGLDVVLVTVDALRWDRLGTYGNTEGLTPAIDAIARSGVVIERAYCTTPHTSYSLASLMTGKFFRGVSALGVPTRPHQTIAGLLRARGYDSAAYFPPAVFSVDGDRLGDLRARGFDFAHRQEDYASAEQRVRSAIQWLESRPRNQRTLLWVHLFEPHESYENHPGARVPGGASVASRYSSEVAAVDDAVRALHEAYARLGRRAAWFITADHGEEFGEHGGRFHGTTVYEEQARVPFIIAVPGISPRRVRGPASHIDLLPTLLAGLAIDRPPRLRGRDLGPLAQGSPWTRNVFASVGAERLVTDGRFKLVCDVGEGSCELFDLDADPWERNNLADSRADLLARLRPLVAGWDASHARFEAEGERAELRSRDALPPAVERAIQGDRAAAAEAAQSIAGLDARRAIRAVRALAALGVRDELVRGALATATTRNASDLSLEAGVALTRLGDARGVAASRDALASSDQSLSRSAALGLATLGINDGAVVLAQWLDDRASTDQERDAALAALRSLRDPRAFDALARLLEDPRLAPDAALALADLADARAIAPLEALARSTRYSLTRNAAILGLAKLRATVAPALFREALTSEPALSDPFAIAAALGAPIAEISLSSVETQADPRGRARVTFDRAIARGPVTVLLHTRAAQACSARIAGQEASIPAGESLARVSVRSLPRTMAVERCAGLTVSEALATRAPSARDGQ